MGAKVDKSVVSKQENKLINSVLGCTMQEAETILEEIGYKVRATIVDGIPQHITFDMVLNRVNVAISGGVVIKVLHLG